MAVALELQNGIDHMFQNFRSGNGPVFGNMSDQHHGRIGFFGKLKQLSGTFSNLRNAAGRGFDGI